VTIGGNTCASPSINSAGTQITCTIPAGTIGAKDVVVKIGSYGSATKTGAYTYASFITITLSASTVNLNITPTTAGTAAPSSHTTSVKTDNPTGYNLTISTNLPNTNTNALDLKHTAQSQYITGTANACTWNSTSKTLTETSVALSVNTWGFTLLSANTSTQKFCQVPSSSSPLIIKSTTASNQTANGDQTTVYYGAKVNLTKPAGVYKTTVVYTAGTNP
jgi:hypothetical protein